nr:uncharacterized protein LOC104112760 isoform X2 [Nicotiana tomentosiformis]
MLMKATWQTPLVLVQNLIERCLLLGMGRDQCVNALAIHARILPLVTLTVWRELLKENRDFFQVYFNNISSCNALSFGSQALSKRGKIWKKETMEMNAN